MEEQGISSEALMERAATACSGWILSRFSNNHFRIFCGKGNNGGDGLAIARLLNDNKQTVDVYITQNEGRGSEDFEINLQRLKEKEIPVHYISRQADFPAMEKSDIIIDALFGTGLNKPLEGTGAELVRHINHAGACILSIDIPSGLYCDISSGGNDIIRATHTLSFTRKLAFMMAENEAFTGRISFIDIGLSQAFEEKENSNLIIPAQEQIRKMIRRRPIFAHKGTFGHGAIAAGSHGMMGAAVLAARGFLRSGAGKLTCYVPGCGYEIMQTSVPEAMCETSGENQLIPFSLKKQYDAIGAGPGIGISAATRELLQPILQSGAPLVLDADALNGIGADPSILELIPAHTIITPHPGEFDRIFGKTQNDFARLDLAMASAKKHRIYIVLKGHHTASCTPEGKVFFNETGNPGMAKPGMGDVLTGIITGLLAQSHTAEEACILGVHIHGRAGDLAAEKHSQQAMTASELTDEIENVWKEFS